MYFRKGMVVRSKAGHDKGSFFVVVGTEKDVVLVSDGKARTSDKPKKKNPIHLSVTKTVIDERFMENDDEIRKILAVFDGKVRTFKEVM